MNKSIKLTAALCLLCSSSAMAASPIPTFDKEAVTTNPYNRTGQQEVVDSSKLEKEHYQEGNTGTEEDPAFFVKQINLTGFELPDDEGKLSAILDKYSNRNVKVSELGILTSELNEYCRICGYTVPQAIIPAQEIKDGILEVQIYIASYDEINIVKNESDVVDKVLAKYIDYLEDEDVILDKKLEMAINNINDLPGVIATAVLKPGSKAGTTSIDLVVDKRPVWNNYIFVDNGGGYYSGRYRYGFNTEINNPGHQGDKFIINGSITSHDVDNYGIRYETPVGSRGTRVGIAYSKSSYDLRTNEWYDSIGESQGISLYGMTPIFRDRQNRITAIYGYDRRDITDEININSIKIAGEEIKFPKIATEKNADVWHIGISGSQYNVNQFTQYDMIYWYGDIDTEGGAYYDGVYHKLTADWLNIWYDNKFNYRINFHGQMSNRALDGSEQFYLGGINGVRAYGNSDGYGDAGYLTTFEVRSKTDVEGLEVATFLDWGGVKNRAYDQWDHLAGWGLGLRYAKPNDWYAQLDWSKKINAREDLVEPNDHSGRWWFQMYKMF